MVLTKSDCSPNSDEIYQHVKSKIKEPCFLISGKHADGLEPLVVCIRKSVLEQIQKEEATASTSNQSS